MNNTSWAAGSPSGGSPKNRYVASPPEASPAPWMGHVTEATRLPTRVTNACERCRRHKSRCDPFRPCSLCKRAAVQCKPSMISAGLGRAGKKRRRKSGGSQSNAQAEITTSEPLPRIDTRTYSPPENTSHSDGNLPKPRSATADEYGMRTRPVIQSSSPVDYREAESTMGIARKVFQLGSQDLGQLATSALPDGDISTEAQNSGQVTPNVNRLPISSVLGCTLPPEDLMRTLLEEYFDSVHWFSLAIYEPKFRIEFESICDGFARPAQDSFLLLLSVVLGMAAWYRFKRTSQEDSGTEVSWNTWSLQLIKHTESRLFDILEQGSLFTIQTCILLGSYNSYHGKPKSAFALLGATIRTAQAIGLHRESLRGGLDTSEERKRTWWTIYTWDRWASITYGRPLGINDKDCNIPMPGDVHERWQFVASSDQNEETICYSTYQRELNKLYVISSPLIKTIFGIRSYAGVDGRMPNIHFSRMMENISRQLSQWRECLPAHLVFDFDHDISPDASATQKAFHLQALSLQLTFDHLVIILHRPSLVQQISSLSMSSAPNNENDTSSPLPVFSSAAMHHDSPATSFSGSSPHAQLPSSEEWWSAALRTSRVTQLPQTARFAIDGHLVAFLAINIFNAAIVMVVCALSNPLSDRAQDAKRHITRVWRLQELLSRRSKLSMQSCDILKEGVWMVLRREGEAMLATVQSMALAVTVTGNESGERGQEGEQSGVGANGYGIDPRDESGMGRQAFAYPLSVEDALRLPIDLPSEQLRDPQFLNTWQENPDAIQEADETVRLNESLLSLQRVFPGNDFANYQSNSLDGEQNVVRNDAPVEMWQNQSSSNNANNGYRGGFEDSTAEDGLYWIWNSAGRIPGYS